MASSKRVLGVVLGVVALGLTALGVALAATDSNPSGASDSSLALGGKAPTTAKMALTINTGGQYDVTGTVNVNFDTNQVQGTLAIPSAFSTTNIGVILAGNKVYIGVPSLESLVHTPWVSIPATTPDLFGLSAEMAKFNLDLPFLQQIGAVTTTHNGPYTTYSVSRSNIKINVPATSGLTLPHAARISVAVTVASEGQVSEVTLHVGARNLQLNIDLKVLSYNEPVNITPPPADQVQPLTNQLRQKVLGSGSSSVSRLLTPSGIASLGQIRVN